MDFEVYVGDVVDAQGRGPFTVVIYPRAVYEVESKSAWWKMRPADRIPVTRARAAEGRCRSPRGPSP